MAVPRDRPYAQFDFLIDLGTGSTDGYDGGFEACSDIGADADACTDVTLKRGVIGSASLHGWLGAIGDGDGTALRTVRVHRRNEDRTATVQTWTLTRARIIKHVSGPLDAKGTDVAMEELTLAYERLEME